MKLKQLSLCILVACGLAACGGSSSNDNAPTDPGAGTPPPPPPPKPKPQPTVENNGLEVPVDPTRAAPTMSIEKNLTDSVKVAKQLYIDRETRDAIAGYNGYKNRRNIQNALSTPLDDSEWQKAVGNSIKNLSPFNNQGGLSYNPGSTDDADILRASSIYNYYKEQSQEGSLNVNGGIHPNPAFSYAKGADDKYYRVIPNGGQWDNLKANSTFKIVDKTSGTSFKSFGNGMHIPQNALVFIPNALALSGTNAGSDANKAHIPAATEFSNGVSGFDLSQAGINVLDPDNIGYFNVNRGNVQYKSFTLAGQTYDLVHDFNQDNVLLMLDNVAVKKGIQDLPITLKYDVINNQATGVLKDDEVVHKEAKVGGLKVYNLPYSRSLITLNQKAVDKPGDLIAAPNNFFGFAGGSNTDGNYGAFQVAGFPTTALPKDGRTDYTGQSYGVDSVGDVHLRADFGVERPHIWGTVDNRQKLSDQTALPSLVLKEISFRGYDNRLNVASHGMSSNSSSDNGAVTVGGRGVGRWAVGLFGPNAEEAAGVIDLDTTRTKTIDGPNGDNYGKKFEVFSTQRGSIIKDSLNPGVGVVK